MTRWCSSLARFALVAAYIVSQPIPPTVGELRVKIEPLIPAATLTAASFEQAAVRACNDDVGVGNLAFKQDNASTDSLDRLVLCIV